MFDYMGAFLFCSDFAHVDNVITKRCSKTITWLLLSRLQGNKPLLNLPKHWNSPEPSGTIFKLPPEPTPAHTRTRRNLPPEPTPAHTGTLRNLLEPSSGTCSCDPHRHTPELIWAEDPISLRCWGKTFPCWASLHVNPADLSPGVCRPGTRRSRLQVVPWRDLLHPPRPPPERSVHL